MKTKVLLILIACLCFTACKKRKYPTGDIEYKQHEVYIYGYLGNEQISLNAGDDGYYCYSSFNQRPDSLYTFEALLKKFECNFCPQSLKFELFDSRKRVPGSPVIVDSSFKIGSRGFTAAIAEPGKLRFSLHANKQVSSVLWETSTGYKSSDPDFEYEFTQPGLQTVSLTFRSASNCESKVENKIYVGSEGRVFACDIAAESVPNDSVIFHANTVGGKLPYVYTWYFGDGKTIITSVPTAPKHGYQWTGSYPVKLKVEDADHHVCEANYIHVTANDNSSCAAYMGVLDLGSRNGLLNTVRIVWTDQSNVVFKSDNISQPLESYFEVLKSEEYQPNEKGEPGRLLTVRFNILLSDGNHQLWFKCENAAIAVAYK